MGDVHRKRPRGGAARLLRLATAGAPAALRVPPAVPRHGPVRGADDVLDHAGRAVADARPRAHRPRGQLRGGEPRRGVRGGVRGDEAHAPGADRVSGVLLWAAVGALGGAGAVARLVLDAAVAARAGRALPVGTFVVNVSGAFALGLVSGLGGAGDALLLAGPAALAPYPTFSPRG